MRSALGMVVGMMFVAYLSSPVRGQTGSTVGPNGDGGGAKSATVGKEGANAIATTSISAAIVSGTTNSLAKFVNSTDLGNSLLFDNGSRIGLGTTNPGDVFHVSFNNTIGSLTGYAVQNLGSGAAAYSGMLFYDQNGALAQFQGFNNSTHEYRINNVASNGSINFMLGSSSKFFVGNNGNIGIGTTNPAHTLHVNGTIGTTEIIVSSTGADYVFEPTYRLQPLKEVSVYINEHHHLPEIPSANEVKENGVSLGEMQAKLLAKIEELTLHMIREDERNNSLEQQNRELQERIARLEGRDAEVKLK